MTAITESLIAEKAERVMRAALGLNSVDDVKRPKPAPRLRTPGLQVILSVREKWGGKARRFIHVAPTVSRLVAQIEAEKAARAKGLNVWAVIDICVEDTSV